MTIRTTRSPPHSTTAPSRAPGSPPRDDDDLDELFREVWLETRGGCSRVDLLADLDDLAPEGTGADDIDWSSWDCDED